LNPVEQCDAICFSRRNRLFQREKNLLIETSPCADSGCAESLVQRLRDILDRDIHTGTILAPFWFMASSFFAFLACKRWFPFSVFSPGSGG